MGDFSQDPQAALKNCGDQGYVGIHIEQGVPILDRDLNLLHDLAAHAVRNIAARYIGDGGGSAATGFLITALPAGQNANDFSIGADPGATFPAHCLVGGIEVQLKQALKYSKQAEHPALTKPAADRTDLVYLDVWITEADGFTDEDLRNERDVGLQTSVRLKAHWAVRVAEGTTTLPPLDGHNRYPLATLARTAGKDAIEQPMITDLRRTRLNVADLERRLTALEVALLLPAFTGDEFTPRSGPVGLEVTISGLNLDTPGTTVAFGTKNAKITEQTVRELKALIPDLGVPIPAGGSVQIHITVTTSHGSITSTSQFSVRN
jgi:hypothetical protein